MWSLPITRAGESTCHRNTLTRPTPWSHRADCGSLSRQIPDPCNVSRQRSALDGVEELAVGGQQRGAGLHREREVDRVIDGALDLQSDRQRGRNQLRREVGFERYGRQLSDDALRLVSVDLVARRPFSGDRCDLDIDEVGSNQLEALIGK